LRPPLRGWRLRVELKGAFNSIAGCRLGAERLNTAINFGVAPRRVERRPRCQAGPACYGAATMKGKTEILELLNEVLTAELTAINQYFIHARMLKNWGFSKLAEHVYAESIDEMKHADELIERILYLEGVPNLQRYGKINVGETPKEQLELDLKMEYAAVERFNRGIALCRDQGDNGSRDLLEKMLVSEEGHVDWLETQLDLIGRLGEERYLAEQM
jgi:bacterioferritin